jgi:hypothetical protein
MTLRQIIAALQEHAEAWPMNLDRPIYIRVGRQVRQVESTYIDTGFILVAGQTVYEAS